MNEMNKMNTNNEKLNNEGENIMEQQEMMVCDGCGCEFKKDELLEMQDTGHMYCESCASDCYVCDDCGANFEEFNGDEYHTLCSDCIGYYTECERCGNLEHNDDITMVVSYERNWRGESMEWCSRCVSDHATRCSDCRDYVVNESTYNTGYGDTICEHCYDNYGTCECCGEIYHTDDLYWDESDEYYYCQSCYEGRTSTGVRSYSYKPDPQFFGEDSKLYLGVELEVGGASHSSMEEAAEELSTCETFYLKEDGSIPSYGFEIVSHPCTYRYHRDSFNWKSVTDTCRENGLRGHDLGRDCCGMHIHASRHFMSETRWCLFEYFLTKTQTKWSKLARRSNSHWGKFKEQERTGKLNNTFGRRGQHDRYSAVNFYNTATVEIRIFRSTLKASTITATIGAVDAAVRFVKELDFAKVKESGSLWKAFCAYLTACGGTYAEVIEHFKNLDIFE